MQRNELRIGDRDAPDFVFTNAALIPEGDKSRSTLMSVEGTSTTDLIGNELSIDLLDPVVHYVWHAQRALQPTDADSLVSSDGYTLFGFWNDNPVDVPYGTPVWYFVNGELSAKFYMEHVDRIGRDQWAVHAVSVVGLLDLQPHRGGVYTGQTFASVLTEFFGGTVGESANGFTPVTGGIADCYVEDAVAITTVHGLLEYSDSKRKNLHELLFSYIVNLTKNADGDLVFSYLRPADSPPMIDNNRIYLGGEVDYQQPITDVELEEYTYILDETVEAVKIYDNTTAPHTEGEALVIFKTPVDPETIYTSEETMTVRDANETSAYVTGHGIIYAIPYQIQQRTLTRSVDRPGARKSVSVSNVKLVNPLNSSNLMDKLFEFYTQRRVVSASLKVEGEKTGQLYSFISPYGEETQGFLQTMEWSASGITRADCTIITDYTPTGVTTNLQNVVLLTGSGVWEVPPAIKARDNPYIRVTLIGGGQGGHGGYKGADSLRKPDDPGQGGEGGEGGLGGKVLNVDIDVTDIDSFVYSCGEGGQGGESDTEGALGGDTVFGEFSTAAGAIAPGGIMNLMNGKFYARSGGKGLAGAAGGKGAKSSSSSPSTDELAQYGRDGEPFTYLNQTWEGGSGGKTVFASQGGYFGWAFGSGGGGAAYGADGGDGNDGHVEWQAVIGGKGGSGATPTVPGKDAQDPGCGGNGGHGGGGAGAPGDSGWSAGVSPTGYEGIGGLGSIGGRGADGAILIYF